MHARVGSFGVPRANRLAEKEETAAENRKSFSRRPWPAPAGGVVEENKPEKNKKLLCVCVSVA